LSQLAKAQQSLISAMVVMFPGFWSICCSSVTSEAVLSVLPSSSDDDHQEVTASGNGKENLAEYHHRLEMPRDELHANNRDRE